MANEEKNTKTTEEQQNTAAAPEPKPVTDDQLEDAAGGYGYGTDGGMGKGPGVRTPKDHSREYRTETK